MDEIKSLRYIDLENEAMKLNSLFIFRQSNQDYSVSAHAIKHRDKTVSLSRARKVLQKFNLN